MNPHLRAQGIGGSEIASVVGLSPYVSAFELWHRKKGNLPEQGDKPQFTWGHLLEPVIAQHFADEHPEYDLRSRETTTAPNRDWQVASIDREVIRRDGGGSSVLEIKTARYPDGWGKPGTDEIPLHYRCQVQWYMDALGLVIAHVAVLIGGSDYREYTIPYDADDARTLREAGAEFWRSICEDEEPPLDCSDSTYQTVKALHPDIDEDETAVIPFDLHAAYEATKTARDDADDAHRQAKSHVLHVMGNARKAQLDDGTFVFRRQPAGKGVALHAINKEPA